MLLSGLGLAQNIEQKLIEILAKGQKQGLAPPKLAIIHGNDSPASKIYIKKKIEKCTQLGCQAELFSFSPFSTKKEVLELVSKLNVDQKIHGILCQLPVFKHWDGNEILQAISPKKDVDGLHPENMGLLLMEKPRFIPCTPQGILWLLDFYQFNLQGKHAFILGRSSIVGRPLSILLSQKKRNMSVTLCHSYSKNWRSLVALADLLIVAVGKPHLLSEETLKKDAIVIDVGVNSTLENGISTTLGDVDTQKIEPKVAAVSQVPGGVGPLTIVSLIYNLCLAAGYPCTQTEMAKPKVFSDKDPK